VILSDGFALFETVLGHCRIAWSGNGIVAVQLPEIEGVEQTRAVGQAPAVTLLRRLYRVTGYSQPERV
jgi:hypothetical protein